MQESIGALWQKDGAKGQYFSGMITIDNVAHPIVLFKNTFKKTPNQPDWRIFPSRPRPAADADSPF